MLYNIRDYGKGGFAHMLDLKGNGDTGYVIRELGNKISKLEVVQRAYFELLQEKGISEEDLNRKIDEIVSRDTKGRYGGRKKACPKCGKTVQESNSNPFKAHCVMCGETVMFYPYEPDQDPTETPPDPLDGLGF